MEETRYAIYINAMRTQDHETLGALRQEGFVFDKRRLAELSSSSSEVRAALYDREVRIMMDSGHWAGHVYAEMPVENRDTKIIEVQTIGKNPAPNATKLDVTVQPPPPLSVTCRSLP